MRWATRAGIHIDRAASARLVRRLVDPDAELVLMTDPDVPADATTFDMRGVGYGHHTGPVFDGLDDYYRRSLVLGKGTPA